MYSRATEIIQQTQKYISSLCGINPSEDSNQKQKLSKTTNGIRLHKHDANFQPTLSLSLLVPITTDEQLTTANL